MAVDVDVVVFVSRSSADDSSAVNQGHCHPEICE
jgi:hypothetical protein